ncbi:MAG: SDR family NAD(P)-dependent oxidoreductase [Clostridium sp.]
MKEKYIVITGASSGIGCALAKKFATLNKNLILVSRNIDELEKIKNEILKKYNLKIILKQVDLSITSNVYKFYSEIQEYEIETFINNAGFGDYSNINNLNINKIDNMIDLNIKAVAILSILFIRDYANVENTQLINISSCGGYILVPTAIPYCATKFFVSAFTEGLAQELKENKLKMRAKVFAPAATKTNFGNVANNINDYNYEKSFKVFNTLDETVEFFIELYLSDRTIGLVDREKFTFELKDPIFEYANKSIHNQKN